MSTVQVDDRLGGALAPLLVHPDMFVGGQCNRFAFRFRKEETSGLPFS